MREHWKSRDRECVPCPDCGTELYEAFWGNGGWVKTEKGTEDHMHTARDCVRALQAKLAACAEEQIMSEQAKKDVELDDNSFDNDVVCPAVYKWLKGDGPEPYSPVVASLTVMVCNLIDRDRKRRAKRRCHHTRCEAGTRKCLDCGDYVTG